MQYIAIKQETKNNKEIFIVSAIPLKNTNKSVVQKIPHPLGTDTIEFPSLEDAKNAVIRAGFSYILPDGKKGSKTIVKQVNSTNGINYEQLILNTIKDKINSSNSTVVAAAILALSEFPNEETFDILFNQIGEDNDLIRKNAIAGICRYPNILQNRIIDSLKSSNWVERNSALSCISNITETNPDSIEIFIKPLCQACNDSNTIVQTNAITTLAKVYQVYQKNK